MAAYNEMIDHDFRDADRMGRPALLHALRELWRFTDLHLDECDHAYHHVLSTQAAPNLLGLEVRREFPQPMHDIPSTLFRGTVPPKLSELSLARVNLSRRSPFLYTPMLSLRLLSLSECGDVWADQGAMFDTLRLFPNLEDLMLSHLIPHARSRRATETVVFENLSILYLKDLPSSIHAVLAAIRAPKNFQLGLVLHCVDMRPSLWAANLSPLVPLIRRCFSDRAVHDGFGLLSLDVRNATAQDRDGTQWTAFELEHRTIDEDIDLPDVAVTINHQAHVQPTEWIDLFRFMTRALPAGGVTQLSVYHEPYLPDFPWVALVQGLPRLSSLTLKDIAPQSAAHAIQVEHAQQLGGGHLVSFFSRLRELDIVDAELLNPRWRDNSRNGRLVMTGLCLAFYGSAGMHANGRRVVVTGCRIDQALAQFITPALLAQPGVQWVDNDLVDLRTYIF